MRHGSRTAASFASRPASLLHQLPPEGLSALARRRHVPSTTNLPHTPASAPAPPPTRRVLLPLRAGDMWLAHAAIATAWPARPPRPCFAHAALSSSSPPSPISAALSMSCRDTVHRSPRTACAGGASKQACVPPNQIVIHAQSPYQTVIHTQSPNQIVLHAQSPNQIVIHAQSPNQIIIHA